MRGILKTTELEWFGRACPPSVFANVRALSVQGLLLLGAVFALVLVLTGEVSTT